MAGPLLIQALRQRVGSPTRVGNPLTSDWLTAGWLKWMRVAQVDADSVE